jgi:hypothetical protein
MGRAFGRGYRAGAVFAGQRPGDNLSILPAGADDEKTGDLNISNTVALMGAGAASTTIDANQIDRVLDVETGTVSLSQSTLQNGNRPDLGGGLMNTGRLALNDVVFQVNQSSAGSSGGAIVNGGNVATGTLTLNNTVIRGDASGGNGGRVLNGDNSVMTLNRSSVVENHTVNGGYGGGIVNDRHMTLTDSLVNGNQTTPQTSNPVAGCADNISLALLPRAALFLPGIIR